jgi:competence protein ComGC
MKTANDLVPTIIVLLIMTLLAVWIVAESNKRQQEIIDTVRQAQIERQNATLEAIRKRMGNDELWQQVKPKISTEP